MPARTVWAALVAMGFAWVVAQVLLLRQLLVAFGGNELTVGLILGTWLLSGAVGSVSFARWGDRTGDPVALFIALQVLLAVGVPASLTLGPLLSAPLGLLPGELPGLGPMVLLASLLLVPPAALCGGLFTVGCRLSAPFPGRSSLPAGRVYVAEAVGSALGGVLFSYLLVSRLSTIHIALVVSAVNLAAALALARHLSRAPGRTRRLPWILALLLIADLAVLVSPMADALRSVAQRARWGEQDVVFSEDSAYGNVTVVRDKGQHTYYTDGIPSATTPVPDIAAVEEQAHLPALFHPAPDSVLVVGNGMGGLLSELLKHPVAGIDYVERDPLLFRAATAVADTLVAVELSDSRVEVHIADGRRFVARAAAGRYDLVIVGLPPPASLSLNRYFTQEFFTSVRGALAPGGILALSCPSSATYLTDDLRRLHLSLESALASAFPHVRAIPGETTLYLASQDAGIRSVDAEALSSRLLYRKIAARLITPAHLAYRLDSREMSRFQASLGSDSGPANTDLMPVSLFHIVGHRIAQASPGLRAFLTRLEGLRLRDFLIPLAAVCLLLVLALQRTGSALRIATPMSLAATGFAGMALSIVLLMAYQTLYGVLYRQLALFTAAFALGLSVGAAAATRLGDGRDARAVMIGVEFALLTVAALVAVVLAPLAAAAPSQGGEALFIFLNALLGALVGAQFPAAARICIPRTDRVAAPAGALYAADLAGAWIGALSVPVLLLPSLGLVHTCVLVAAVKVASLLAIALGKRR